MNYNFFKLILILSVLFLILCGSTNAQNITAGTYTFARSGFSPTTITGTQLIGPNSDQVASAVTDIGFTFWFAGQSYTQFSVNENGVIALGSTPIPGNASANSLGSSPVYPIIAPYWDDLATGTNGSVVYAVQGTAPNRTLFVNWLVTVPKNAGGTAVATIIQASLFEATGVINFTYGWPALPANSGQYSVGIAASSTDFASVTVTGTGATATCAYGTANNTNTLGIAGYSRFSFTPDAAAPTITHTALTGTLSTDNRTLTATIADPKTGVPTSGTFVPRIYYKKNEGSYISAPGTLTAGTSASGTWTFLIDHAAVGNVVPRDKIYYFIVAQDQSTTLGKPNISSNPAGVVATDVNTIITPPATLNTYKILGAPLSGTVTVGTGGNYTSLSNPGGLFEDINDGKLVGNLLVNIISDLSGEIGNVALNPWVNEGGIFTVTINPQGNRTISGAGNPLRFFGTIGLTIDGLNDGTNSFSFDNGSGFALQFSKGASNNTVKRSTVKGVTFNDNGGTHTIQCSNNSFTENIFDGLGIEFSAFGSIPVGVNNVIDKNIFRNFGQRAIHLDRGFKDFTVSNNEFYQTSGILYATAINIYLAAGVGVTNVFNNYIHDLATGTSFGTTSGITYSGPSGTLNIYNNVIALSPASLTADKIMGINIGGNGTVNVYYNSIYIGGTGITSGNSVGINRTGATVNLKNNAIYNARSLAAASQYYKNYGVVVNNTTNLTSDNNLIFVDGTGGVTYNVGANIGMSSGTDYVTLADWVNFSSKDVNSVSGNPAFTSVSNLTPNVDDPNSNNLNDKGTPIAAISSDILGNPRSTALPTPTDIGAYEFTPTVIPVTISGNAGVPGAVINFAGGSATADNNGNYSFDVAPGWTGTLTPVLAGYVFNPKNRVIDTPLNADLSGQDFSATELPAGLISYWNLNETSGNTYLDLAQLGDGTGNVSPAAVLGQVGGAQEFNGSTNKIDIPVNTAYDFAAGENFSIAFWYNGSTAPGVSKAVLSRYIPASYWYIGLHTDGKAKFYMKAGTDVMGVYGSIITNGSWHHVVVTRNGSSGLTKIYVDGALRGSATKIFTTDFSSPDIGLTMGGMTGFTAYQLQGKLDEVAMFNNELSAADILDHYNRGLINAAFFGNYAPFITSLPALNGLAGEPYTYDVEALGLPLPSFSLSNPPADMTIDAVSGVINWLPSVEGNYTVTVVADNGVAPADTQTFIINVAPAVNLPVGLSAYWSLNEAAGNTYADLTTKNNGTGNTNPTALLGQVQGAQLFNGSSDKIEVNADPTLDFAAADDFSIEYWFNGSGAPGTYKAAVSRYIPTAYWYMGLHSDGKAKFYMRAGTDVMNIYGPVVTDGNWHHVAVTRNGSTGLTKIYIDGVLKGSATKIITANFASPTVKLAIGGMIGFTGYSLAGALDEVAIHKAELSQADVTDHFNRGTANAAYFGEYAPFITSVPSLNGVSGQPYSYDVDALGLPAPTFSLLNPPADMTIDQTSGVISWTPADSGHYNISVVASNSVSADTQSFTIAVALPITFPSSLIAYWKLDESAGNTYLDVTNLNNGTGNTSPVSVTGYLNNAQQFNGTTNKIEVNADTSLDFSINDNFSMEFWYNGSTLPGVSKAALSRYTPAAYWYFGLHTDGRAKFYMRSGADVMGVYGTVVTDGTWHHIAVTRNGSTGLTKIYVDGVLRGSATKLFTADFSSSTAKLAIGGMIGFSGYFIAGMIDEAAIHRIELTSAQVLQHFTGGPLSKDADPELSSIPQVYNLAQNYPNPFNPTTNIRYELPAVSRVNIRIFNVIGEQVTQLVNDIQPAGFYNQKWNAANMPSGIYFLRIEASGTGSDDNFVKTVKMLLMK